MCIRGEAAESGVKDESLILRSKTAFQDASTDMLSDCHQSPAIQLAERIPVNELVL